ncbi:MAG: DUF3821 domain-containing protein, partial [Methanophagales archaeon]|nr:DUF3821 domain-containing protein [Methanophagales archaeon]
MKKAKKGEGEKEKRFKKAIIGILFTLIISASVIAVMVQMGSAQPAGAKREADGSIIGGNTLFIGEHGLHFDVAYSDAVWLNRVSEIITIADPSNFFIPAGVETGIYGIWNATSKIGYLAIKEPEINGDVFIEGTTDSIVGKTIPVGTKIRIRACPNFGGLMNASDGSGWSKTKVKLIDPDGIYRVKKIDADASEIDITSDDWDQLDTFDWDTGMWKVKIVSDRATCNEVDVSSPEYEFTVRTEELSIEAVEDTVGKGEDIILKVTGNPITYYYLIVTSVDVTAPPAIMYTSDVKALDTAGDAYPATGTPNLAAWIKTGSDGIADVKVATSGADERTYTIKVYYEPENSTGSLTPITDFVPDEEIVMCEDDDDIDIEVTKAKVTFDMPTKAVIGEEVTIKGVISAGDEVDILIDDGDIEYFDDEPVDEDNEFEVEWDTAGLRTGTYTIDVYIDCPYDSYDEIETAGIDEDGRASIRLISTSLTVNLSTNITQPGGTIVINGTAMGTDHVDIITISPGGGDGVGLYEKSYPGVPGITNESIPVENNSFSKTINVSDGVAPTPTSGRGGGRDGGGGVPCDSDGDGISDIDEMLAGT